MTEHFESGSLFYVTDNNQKLPDHLVVLFKSAIDGDEDAKIAIVEHFTPSIHKIASKIRFQYNLNEEDDLHKLLVNSGINTLMELLKMYSKDGFCKFILFAIRQNMIYTLATGSDNF